eukprot:gene26697-34487_t
MEGKAVYGSTLVKAAADTDQTLRVGARFVDAARGNATGLMDSSAHYLSFMQTPRLTAPEIYARKGQAPL